MKVLNCQDFGSIPSILFTLFFEFLPRVLRSYARRVNISGKNRRMYDVHARLFGSLE